ncbi:N-carbamoyl-D-amino-acid hydrolase [Salipiger mucosus]|uniref:N-carbamoyl-D-amino acid hydrolase, putative n=1 Tax=Salipiger mucosus DSM 16094 TaxID=1123237 RepID=S9REM8_9RHOB|nr:N-carbamoyl-D-amino-acid hydrolase [Salipiger mucosus]EPX76580.1 N-carbamoyl-D-amino acid hydrolase, putative [Salipiger mucosus DSM 16094]
MSRSIVVATAQLGPIARDEPRASAVARMIALMETAHSRGARLVVFPELALTTFFPRWLLEGDELDAFYETEMPGPDTAPLFEAAKRLGVGFYLGYAELLHEGGTTRRFNTSIFVTPEGEIAGRYRKVHLPGHYNHEDWRRFQHLEKRYFEHGDLGFPVFEAMGGTLGMCLCNDRRWPETFRVLGLRGAELIMLGYNTPQHYPQAPEHDHLQDFHNHLSMQHGAYANGAWVIGTAKAGREEGCDLIAGSCIIAPTGEIIARTQGVGDEVAVAEIDLDRCRELRENVFNFALHREPGDYGPICEGAEARAEERAEITRNSRFTASAD